MTTTHVDIWNECLRIIQEEIAPQSFECWFKPIIPIRIENSVLTIEVPSQFFYEWLEEHYLGMLKRAIHQTLGAEGRLEYSIVIENSVSQSASTIRMPTASHNSSSTTSNSLSNPLNVNRPVPNPFVIPGIRKFEVESNLNANYTFETFIEGDCNRLARAAGYAVANKPGITAYNPLFIFSGVGLGKTHLLQAIGNEIKANFPRKAVLYVSSERFINQFIEAVR